MLRAPRTEHPRTRPAEPSSMSSGGVRVSTSPCDAAGEHDVAPLEQAARDGERARRAALHLTPTIRPRPRTSSTPPPRVRGLAQLRSSIARPRCARARQRPPARWRRASRSATAQPSGAPKCVAVWIVRRRRARPTAPSRPRSPRRRSTGMPASEPLAEAAPRRATTPALDAREPRAAASQAGPDLVGDRAARRARRRGVAGQAETQAAGTTQPPRPSTGSTSTAADVARARARASPRRARRLSVAASLRVRREGDVGVQLRRRRARESWAAAPQRRERAMREPVVAAIERDDARACPSRASPS